MALSTAGFLLARSRLVGRYGRLAIYRLLGARIDTLGVSPGCFITGPAVTIGRGTSLNIGCLLDASAPITIGRRTSLGPGVMVLTSTHAIGSPHRRAGTRQAKPVTIGSGCWIGARSTILPGVTIHDGCVIAAGAVVTQDCEPGGLYAGVPARRRSFGEGAPDTRDTDRRVSVPQRQSQHLLRS